MDGFETLAVLTRSPVRLHVLRHLLEEGQTNASELAHQVDASRRTVSRALDVLEEEELAVSNGHTYRATTYTELVAPDVLELLESIEVQREQAAFLEAFPRDAIDVDLESVDGTVTCRREAQPHGPVSTVVSTLSDATSIRVLAPIASPLYVQPLAKRVRSGATIEAVVAEDAYDEFCTKLRTGIRLAATLTDVSLAVCESVEFGLLHCDEQVILGAYEDGILQATLETSDEVVVEVAHETYQQYRNDAKEVIS